MFQKKGKKIMGYGNVDNGDDLDDHMIDVTTMHVWYISLSHEYICKQGYKHIYVYDIFFCLMIIQVNHFMI